MIFSFHNTYLIQLKLVKLALSILFKKNIDCFSTYISSKGTNYNLLTYHKIL